MVTLIVDPQGYHVSGPILNSQKGKKLREVKQTKNTHWVGLYVIILFWGLLQTGTHRVVD